MAQDFLRSLEKIVQAKIIPTQLSVCPLGKGSNCCPNLISRSKLKLVPKIFQDAVVLAKHLMREVNLSPPQRSVAVNYGVISLFDGASTVVKTISKKLGCPPKAILLAENDEVIRKLVCAEYGYRADQKWGYTIEGSACLYIKDVNLLAENDCLILRQTAALFPGLKWFIVGGSPCQDLTYAGFLHGLLGLVGERSRLFFVLLLTIRTMQVLYGNQAIRFLVENAGSMRDVHFVAFCKLLNLPYKPFHRYIWDLAKHTPFVTRKRNFFRNAEDFETNHGLTVLDTRGCGTAPFPRRPSCSFCAFTKNQENVTFWDLPCFMDTLPTTCVGLGLHLLEW